MRSDFSSAASFRAMINYTAEVRAFIETLSLESLVVDLMQEASPCDL
jgi:hypothetical protein